LKNIIYSPGEPAGVGPDLIIKLSCSKTWNKISTPIIVIGDKDLFEARAKLLNKKIKL
jgi:4-hydroxythreonine-4-phosphate dehydrogenase